LKDFHIAGRSRVLRLARLGLDGSGWYDSALSECRDVCELEGWNLRRFVGVLASTSPVVAVRRNVRTTLQYMQNGQFFSNTMKVQRDLVAKFEETGRVGGIKVAEFYRAILGDRSACVLDTWMSYVFYVKQGQFKSSRLRESCRRVLASVGRTLGLCVRDTQAAVWGGAIAEYGRNPLPYPIRAEYDNWLAHDRNFPTVSLIDSLDLSKVGYDPLPF